MLSLDQPVQIAVATASAATAGAAIAISDYTTELLGVPLAVILAGFAGALFSLSISIPVTLSRAAWTVLGNTLAASYCAHLVMHFLNVPDKFHLGAAFLVGALAQFGILLLMDVLRARVGGSKR